MSEYSVALTRAGHEPALVDVDDQIFGVQSLLDSYAPVVSYDASRYTIRLALEAGNASGAADDATALTTKAIEETGLPVWPIVEMNVVEWSLFERQLEEPTFPELVGITEIADLAGVTKQRASVLARRDTFPRPFQELASGPVWLRPNVERFVAEWERKPGRPRKQSA